MIKIVVTGASGFIGKHFLESNQGIYHCVPCSLRVETIQNIDLKEVDCILHLAGIAHQKKITSIDRYREINTLLATSLAQKAKEAGVKQFIYMSSAKVYGDSYSHEILDINSIAKPTDAYGISKLEAEGELDKLNDDKFTISIIRTPVVYGPEVKGNIKTLMKFINSGRTLPLRGLSNRRSMVYIGNLILMVNKIIDRKSKGIFIAGDDAPISTSELVEYISDGLGVKNRSFKLPSLFQQFIRLLKPGFYNRVFNSFELNNKESLDRLKISTQVSTRDGIERMAEWYKQNNK